METVPSHLKYTKTHEWARLEEDGRVRVGITEHAQHLLGDMVFVELPDVTREVKSGEECAVVESVKAAADVYSPVSGSIASVNKKLLDAPETVNSDPYGAGWLFVIQPNNSKELEELITPDAYAKIISEGA